MFFRCFVLLVLTSVTWNSSGTFAQTAKKPTTTRINFDRDIQPLLSDRCFLCHGPDASTREADLRLDVKESALAVISLEDPNDSELTRRIFSNESDIVMPPPDSNLALSASEKERLAQWIREGAEWKEHWSFQPREPVQPPDVLSTELVFETIDRFLLSRLEQEKLSYAKIASKEKLIRRLSFDLTGLPPTLEEIDSFLIDEAPDAYERLVDRLLESPHYGQRMASDWLDVARYSDTYGYQVDRDRYVWPWRDWVIRSFNSNMPYNQFITEQIAGDLIPDATDEQILATTFNRLHPQKVEGGSTEEEFRVEYVADRTQTFATAFLGLTMECARCHDHKYDPISQQEYYELFAFFNNVDESGLYSFFTNSVPTPTLSLMTDDQKKKLQELLEQLTEVSGRASDQDAVAIDQDLVNRALSVVGSPPVEVADFSAIQGGNTRTTDERGNAAVLLTGDDAVTLKSGNFTRYHPFSVVFSMQVPDVKERAVVFHRSRAWTDAGSRGYQLLIEEGKLSASLIHFWPGNALSVKTLEQIPVGQWIDVSLVYDGSMKASGLSIFLDGEPAELEIVRDQLSKNITGGGGNSIAIGERFRDRGFKGGQVSEFRVFDRQLSELEVRRMHDSEKMTAALQSANQAGTLVPSQVEMLIEHLTLNESKFAEQHRADLRAARERLARFQDGLTEIMVMREMISPKPAYILRRGLYDDRLAEVSANFPSVFKDTKREFPKNRFGLAQWLTAPDHPLTARVAVNHFWQLIFGQGLVVTPEDFGRQGAPPTHPKLLDWLANDFVANGWNVRRLLKQMVMSRAYRQSSSASKDLLLRDPGNELLARSPAYRLPAEMLRDNLLLSSGLLVDKIGGAPARPYELAASFKASTPSKGEGLYRRSLYTYWKRTGPAPVMLALDASKRDVCRVKRERTSSPLQALAMLNGPQFVEASRAMSQRLIDQYGSEDRDRIGQDMFRLLTSRSANDDEQRVIQQLYKDQHQHFLSDIESAVEYLSLGEFGSYQSESSIGGIKWQGNPHDFRLGGSPSGTEKFSGSFGRASLFPSEFSQEQVSRLVAVGFDGDVPDGLKAQMTNRGSQNETQPLDSAKRGHLVFPNTSGLVMQDAFTIEAWVKPEGSRSGRIWDKITPGKGDGFLLDLVGGIRLICGETVFVVDRHLPLNEWSHLACSVNLASGRVNVFLNGELVSKSPKDPPVWTTNDLAVLAAWSSVANTLINLDECVTKR